MDIKQETIEDLKIILMKEINNYGAEIIKKQNIVSYLEDELLILDMKHKKLINILNSIS